LAILFVSQLYLLFSNFLQKQPFKKLLVLAGIIVLLGSLSYPFLSHDIFNYLFDAKIVWRYHQNPYLQAPQSFSGDHWLRFMHWVHRTCPYGPIWLLYTLIPGLLSFGKFVINFYGLKLLNGLLFFSTGWLLLKINKNDKKVFAYWFFNPLLVIELLVNAHNDLLMIALFLLTALFIKEKSRKSTWLLFLCSIATKYVSLLLAPVLFLSKKWREIFWPLVLSGFLFAFAYRAEGFQIWYFTWLFMALPLMKLNLFFWSLVFVLEAIILIFKYYPFILTGFWQETSFFVVFRVLFILYGAVFSFFVLQLKPWKNLKIFGRKV